MLDRSLVRMLRCPKCKQRLKEITSAAAATEAFDCPACRLRFPVVDGIPNFIVDQAQRLADEP